VNSWINLTALWKIVVIGVLAGAGLPALFAIGLRAMNAGPHGASAAGPHGASAAGPHGASAAGPGGASAGAHAGDEDDRVFGGSVPGLVVAVLCFAVVLAAVGWGIYSIVSSS
jgi:hypothetical protein